jgi:hypothetical protein
VDLARRWRLACAAALGIALIAASNPSAARVTVVAAQLDYVAVPGCPDANDFQTVVIGRLGYNPFRANASERVIVRIDAAGRALEGRIEWRDAAGGWIGEQTFPSRTGDCGELARAMGFALALQIQLMATTAAEPRPEAAPPTANVATPPATATAPPTDVAPVLPTAIATRQGDTTKLDLATAGSSILVGAGGGVGLGVASSAVPLGRLFAAVEWSRVAVELAAEVSAPSTTRQTNGAGFSQQQFLASLAGCGVLTPLSACLIAKVGGLRVVGEGVDVPATSYGLVAQAGLRLAVTHRLGSRFQIGAHADGLALITRGVVTLDGMPVWTTPRVAALFGVDFGVRFQ